MKSRSNGKDICESSQYFTFYRRFGRVELAMIKITLEEKKCPGFLLTSLFWLKRPETEVIVLMAPVHIVANIVCITYV